MARSAIPSGITYADVAQAIADLETGNVTHEFHESEKYDLIHREKRYPPKAVLGLAARRVAGRTLVPADFSGGESSACFRILRNLGFHIGRKPELPASPLPEFVVGREYSRRTDIHGPLRGQMQGGIATPAEYPIVLLFTGDRGDAYGYEDKFRDDGVFLYTGEGQIGDMVFERGNLAILDSDKNGKGLLLFEQTRRGFVRFVGEAHYIGHHFEQRPDSTGTPRNAIIFELDLTGDPTAGDRPEVVGDEPVPPPPRSLAELRAAACLVPQRSLTPKQRLAVVHYRASAVKRYVLLRARGTCEGCEKPAPFLTTKRQPYLEPHHTTRVADGGPDHPAHVIALCPTCHRKVHHGCDGAAYNDTLSARLLEIETAN